MGMPVTVKGQVTIPKPIRDRLGITPGSSEVEFILEQDGGVRLARAKPSTPPPEDRFDRVIGSGTALKGMSTDEIMRLLRGEDDSDL